MNTTNILAGQQYTSQPNAEKNNNSPSFKREIQEGTPYSIITTDEGETIAAIGNKLIIKEAYNELKERINKIDWDLIIPVIGIMIENLTNKSE